MELRKEMATETVDQSCSVKKVFSNIWQNSQENTCARVSFLINFLMQPPTLIKNETWHTPVNFTKFLRKTFYITTSVAASMANQNKIRPTTFWILKMFNTECFAKGAISFLCSWST